MPQSGADQGSSSLHSAAQRTAVLPHARQRMPSRAYAASSPGSIPCSRKMARSLSSSAFTRPSSWASVIGQQRPRSTPSPGQHGQPALLLLAARRGGGLEILPVDRGFLLPAHLRDLLVQIVQVRPHAHPAFDRGQTTVQRPRARASSGSGARGRLPSPEPSPVTSSPARPCSSWITCWRTRFRSAPSFTSTCAATPSPSRIRPRRRCSVPMWAWPSCVASRSASSGTFSRGVNGMCPDGACWPWPMISSTCCHTASS